MTQETIFDKRPTPPRYDRVGSNTLLEERERTELKAYLELF
jgi:hypothetical protein